MDWNSLIYPVSFASFRDQYWSRAILRIARQDPSYYASLFSEADLEETLFIAGRTGKAVEELAEGQSPRPARGHAGAVATFKAGGSLRIDGVHRFSLKLAKLSRALEKVMSAPVNMNLYLSPSSGKKALPRHFDTHDVFVMQLFGRKGWQLFGPPDDLPLEFLPLMQRETTRDMKNFRLQPKIHEEGNLELTEQFILEPGDFLYLPRGFWHVAETEPGSVSCHLTVGIQPTTYADLMNLAVARAAISEPSLRRPLPLGFATGTDASVEVTRTLGEIMQKMQHKIDPEAALTELSNIFHRSLGGSLENRLLHPLETLELDGINQDSWVHVQDGLVLSVDESQTPAQFISGSRRFQIDASYVKACRFICTQQGFTPAMLPAELAIEQKLVLVKQLISENVLLPSAQGAPRTDAAEPQKSLAGWVPAKLRLQNARVQWVQLDEHGLREPFFPQTMQRLHAENPSGVRGTGLNALLRMKEDLAPSGFIFHVSRCGSTLLANGLRSSAGSIVVSEPQPISELLASSEEWRADGELIPRVARLLQGVLRAYGQRRSPQDRSLVVKFTSWNLLSIAKIRKLWPRVPCLILVRDPLEVAVSCLAEPPGWMRMKQRNPAKLPALASDGDKADTPETTCARVLGDFFKVAATQSDALCRVLDYEELDAAAIADVGQFFDMPLSLERDSKALHAALATYSKDAVGARPFQADTQRKRAAASELLRSQVEHYAAAAYSHLRRVNVAQASLVS